MTDSPCAKLNVYFSEGVSTSWVKTHTSGMTRELINNIRPRQTTTSEDIQTPSLLHTIERRNMYEGGDLCGLRDHQHHRLSY